MVMSCHGDDDDESVDACKTSCNESYGGACVSGCVALFDKSTFECIVQCRTSKDNCIGLCKPATKEYW